MSNPGQHALLIGIDEYPLGPLFGCKNDVGRMHRLLVERFGFGDIDIEELLDRKATRKGILDALERLLARTQQGDRVVLFYAGHGSRMRDREGTKASGYDETLVPIDSGGGSFQNRDITDDEIRLWLLRLVERTPYVTLLFDCCHSATLIRDRFGDGERGLPPDRSAIHELPPSPIPESARTALTGQSTGWLAAADRYVYLGACQDHETAKEHSINSSDGPIRYGLFTYCFTKVASQLTAASSYRDLFERVALLMSAQKSSQHPVCEGMRDRVAFGVSQLPTTRYVLVTQVDGDSVELADGVPAGVLVGSEWELHPPDTKDFTISVRPLPRARVVSVNARCARARVIQPGPLIACLSRAIEVSRPIDARWPIEVVGIEPPLDRNDWEDPAQQIFSAITDSAWLRLAKPDETAKVRVYLLMPRTACRPQDAVPQLPALDRPTWAAIARDGSLCMRSLKSNQPLRVVSNLSTMARQEFVVTLQNPHSRLRDKVCFQVLPRIGGSCSERTALADGTVFDVQVSNYADRRLFIHLLMLDAAGGVSVLYPPAGGIGELAEQHTCLLPTPSGQGWRLEYPEEPVLGLRPDGTMPQAVTVYFLLIASQEPTDLQALSQECMRAATVSAAPECELPLSKLLRETSGGARSILIDGSAAGPTGDWVTSLRSLRLVRSTTSSRDGEPAHR